MVYPGSSFGFYGAAWDGERVRTEPLTPNFDLVTHWSESDARHVIASSLDALVVAVDSIQAHYKSIEAEAKAKLAPLEHETSSSESPQISVRDILQRQWTGNNFHV